MSNNKELQELLEEIAPRIFEISDSSRKNPNCIDGRDDDVSRPSIPG